MPSPRRHSRFTEEDYLEWELDHPEKFEYADGLILAMAGASPRHNEVAVNVLAALHARLVGRCRTRGADQRVVTGDRLHTYPDASVVCGPMQVTFYKGTGTLHNPQVIVEILSDSTREYDLGEKRERYETIPSLQHLVFIEPDTVDVLHVRRTEHRWKEHRLLRDDETLELLDMTLPLAAIYLEPPDSPSIPPPG